MPEPKLSRLRVSLPRSHRVASGSATRGMVGYTALMGADESGTLRRLTDLRREFLEPLIDEHHGRVVKLMGDGARASTGSGVSSIRRVPDLPSLTLH